MRSNNPDCVEESVVVHVRVSILVAVTDCISVMVSSDVVSDCDWLGEGVSDKEPDVEVLMEDDSVCEGDAADSEVLSVRFADTESPSWLTERELLEGADIDMLPRERDEDLDDVGVSLFEREGLVVSESDTVWEGLGDSENDFVRFNVSLAESEVLFVAVRRRV